MPEKKWREDDEPYFDPAMLAQTFSGDIPANQSITVGDKVPQQADGSYTVDNTSGYQWGNDPNTGVYTNPTTQIQIGGSGTVTLTETLESGMCFVCGLLDEEVLAVCDMCQQAILAMREQLLAQLQKEIDEFVEDE